MEIAVTGATGLLGNNLVKELLKNDFRVRAIAIDVDNAPSLANVNVERYKVDIRNKDAVNAALMGCDLVYHCAAKISIHQDKDGSLFETNVGGTLNVTEACLSQNTKLIHVSSIHSFRLPKKNQIIDEKSSTQLEWYRFDYDRSKSHADRIVREQMQRGLQAIIVYPTAMLGPNDYEPSLTGGPMLSYAKNEVPMTITGGFNYVDVRDVVRTLINLIYRENFGETYLLAGEWHRIDKLSKIIEVITGSSAPKFHLPRFFAHIIAKGHMLKHWLLNKKPLYTNQSITSLGSFQQVSDAKARRELGHRCRPIEHTLFDLLNWYQRQGMLSKEIRLSRCDQYIEHQETTNRFLVHGCW